MKNIIFAVFALLVVGIAATNTFDDDYAAPAYYFYEPTDDTITNTEIDTLTVPYGFWSHWNYQTTVDFTNLSGTTDVIAIIQERNGQNGGTWYEVDRDTIAATGQLRFPSANNTQVIDKDKVQGRKVRIILDGGGTHATTYSIQGNYRLD
jgi:hypothetical protein